MLTISQLAKARSVSVKISYLVLEIEQLPVDANKEGKQSLIRRLEQLNNELADSLPPCALEDHELRNLIFNPPKGLWLNLERCEIKLDLVLSWVKQMDHWVYCEDDTPDPQQAGRIIAELKLLFYFGSQEALNVFLDLHQKWVKEAKIVKKLIK
jgi:hypothetical protein